VKKKKEPKTSEAQREAWKRWAAENPDKAQANRNAWAKSEAGRAWLAKNQKKKNKARDKWRAKKRAEATKAAKLDSSNDRGRKKLAR
jgi:hypothetical protein